MTFSSGNFKAAKRLLAAGVATCMFAGAAMAAPLSYSSEAGVNIDDWDIGPVSHAGVSFNPKTDGAISSLGLTGDLSDFSSLLVGGGSGGVKLEFTFLLSQAANENTANLFLNTGGPGDDVELFSNDDDSAGDVAMATVFGFGTPLDFTYCTDGDPGSFGAGGCINNIDGSQSGPNGALSIASSEVFIGADGRDLVFFFFGDGSGDSDLTDLVVAVQATAIPLPAGGLLLLGGLGALGALRRRKKVNA